MKVTLGLPIDMGSKLVIDCRNSTACPGKYLEPFLKEKAQYLTELVKHHGYTTIAEIKNELGVAAEGIDYLIGIDNDDYTIRSVGPFIHIQHC